MTPPEFTITEMSESEPKPSVESGDSVFSFRESTTEALVLIDADGNVTFSDSLTLEKAKEIITARAWALFTMHRLRQ